MAASRYKNFLWAYYKGRLYIVTSPRDGTHVSWFRKKRGWPTSGPEFDRQLRGRVSVDKINQTILYEAYSGPYGHEDSQFTPNEVSRRLLEAYPQYEGYATENVGA